MPIGTSAAELQQKLAELVTGTHAYVDTTQLRLGHGLRKSVRDEVSANCGHFDYRELTMPFKPSYTHRIQLHQPTDYALAVLDDEIDRKAFCNRLDCALDVITPDRPALTELVATHWMRPYRRQELGSFGETTYSSRRRWVAQLAQNRIAICSDTSIFAYYSTTGIGHLAPTAMLFSTPNPSSVELVVRKSGGLRPALSLVAATISLSLDLTK